MQKLTRNQKMTRAAMLGAITVVLAATPLGYIPLNPALTITLMVVPVALGGLVLGWPVGLCLGLVFGITSFVRAPTEALGVLLLQQSLVLAFLGCVLPRAVVGLVADGCGRLIRKNEKLRRVWFYALAGFLCSLCNTVLFLGFIWVAFNSAVTGITLTVLLGFVVSNGIFEMIANSILVAVLARVMNRAPKTE